MNFFEHQYQAKRNTRILIGLFAIAVMAVAFATAFVIRIYVYVSPEDYAPPIYWADFYDRSFLIYFVGVGLGIMALSAIKSISMSKKGSSIALSYGATPILPNTQDHLETRLVNVAEEIALASRLTVPKVFVLKGEQNINAFAAGINIHHSAIVVTQGALEKLTRDELQAVVAHEFSHVLNGDSKLNIEMYCYLYGLSFIFDAGRILLRSLSYGGRARRSRGRSGDATHVIGGLGLALLIIGGLGMFFTSLIRSMVSKQREFLADASAVQFTRNGPAVLGVLKKLKVSTGQGYLKNTHVGEFSHMCFSRGVYPKFFSFATHPPLIKRIQAIDPNYTEIKFKTEAESVLEALILQERKSKELKQPKPVAEVNASALPKLDFATEAVLAAAAIESLNQGLEERSSAVKVSQNVVSNNKEYLDLIHTSGKAVSALTILCFDFNQQDLDDCWRASRGLMNFTDQVSRREFAEIYQGFQKISENEKLIVLNRALGFLQNDTQLCEKVPLFIYENFAKKLKPSSLQALYFLMAVRSLDDSLLSAKSSLSAADSAMLLIDLCLEFHKGHGHSNIRATLAEKYSGLTKLNQNELNMPNLLKAISTITGQSPDFKRGMTEALLKCAEADGKIVFEEYHFVSLICSLFEVPLPFALQAQPTIN